MLVQFRFRDVRLFVVVENFAPRERMQRRTVESLLPTRMDVEYLFEGVCASMHPVKHTRQQEEKYTEQSRWIGIRKGV